MNRQIATFVFIGALTLACCKGARGEASVLQQGEKIALNSGRLSIDKIDDLPYVQNEFSKRFHFDSYDNPKLKTLAEQYHLRDVVAPGKDEFERQLLLLDWVNHEFKKFGAPDSKAAGALAILKDNESGHTFFCAHFADTFASAAASLGWVDRTLALRRADSMGTGSTEHSSTEIWSNQYRKWVMLDPTFAMYAEKDGKPLSAYELRQAWFYGKPEELTFVLDKEKKRVHKSDMPIFRARYSGFGDLNFDASALNPYAFLGYVPNTNLMDAGPDYGGMFITRDKLCDGTKWHERIAPPDPAKDPYFPIDQAALSPAVNNKEDGLQVGVRTMTPNFKTFESRVDGGAWSEIKDNGVNWPVHEGKNRLEVRSVNQFGVEGPVSTVEATFTK